jgi:hypothetical protein
MSDPKPVFETFEEYCAKQGWNAEQSEHYRVHGDWHEANELYENRARLADTSLDKWVIGQLGDESKDQGDE